MKRLIALSICACATGAIACSQQNIAPTQPSAATAVSAVSSTSGHGGKLADLPVTTSISPTDLTGAAADITDDNGGVYSNGLNNVISILTANGYNGIAWGDWQFDTLSSTGRSVGHSFDQDDAIQAGDPHYQAPANPPYWGTQLHPTRIEVKCTLQSKSMLTMQANTSITCPMPGHFTLGGNDWGFGPALGFTGFPDETDVQIDCLSVDTKGCNSWNLRPIGSTPAVGRLGETTSGPHSNNIDDGDFYLRFLIHVTRP